MAVLPTPTRLGALFIGAAVLLSMPAAQAHTPFLLPLEFGVSRDHVTLQAALSEDLYFVPDLPIRNADYYVTGPDGQRARLDALTQLKDFTAIEVPLAQAGTYKFSTGDQSARVSKMALIDGQWRMVRPAGAKAAPPMPEPKPGDAPPPASQNRPRAVDETAIPADAQVIEVQSVQRVETYVTKGAPSNGALQATGQGFEVHPITHPNEIYLDQGFTFEVLNDGKPVRDVAFTVYRGGNAYDDKKIALEAHSGADGRVTLNFERPGIYLMNTRYPAAKRGVADTPASRTTTYTMTFEVVR